MNTTLPQWIVFTFTGLMLLFAPLIRGGNTALALMVLESISLCILFCLFWWRLHYNSFPHTIGWFLGLGIGLATLYLIPLPESLWRTLPGRELYTEVYDWLAREKHLNMHLALSLIPGNTLYSLLALLPPLAIFLAVGSLDGRQTCYITYLFLLVAGLQAAIGLTQYAAGYTSSASGTYPSRDHFVAFMEMAFPVAMGLTAYSIGRQPGHHDHGSSQMETKLNSTLFFASITLLLLLAGIFSRSRAGVALMMLGILLSSLVFARHIGGKRSATLTTTLITIGLGIAGSIGLIPVLNRFVQSNPVEDLRFELFNTVLVGIRQFLPFGSGPGTFADVYRALQPRGQTEGFVNNAHNDYLELLFDTGSVGAVVIIAFFILYISGWVRLSGQEWRQKRFIKMGAGIGMLLLLLHAFADFNFHIPANLLFFAFLAGLFFKIDLPEKSNR